MDVAPRCQKWVDGWGIDHLMLLINFRIGWACENQIQKKREKSSLTLGMEVMGGVGWVRKCPYKLSLCPTAARAFFFLLIIMITIVTRPPKMD